MSKPTLTIITTPASAPATEPPTPAYDEEPCSAHPDERSPSTGQLQSPSDCSDQIGRTGRESPSTDEMVGTPGIAQDGGNRSSVGGQEEAGKAKAWSSTISTSYGLEASTDTGRDDFAESSGRAVEVKVWFPLSNSGSCPKIYVRERENTDNQGKIRLNTSGPNASPASLPSKSGPSGFKAFLMKTFGLGKSSSDEQKKKDRTPVASPSPSSKTRNQRSPALQTQLPVAATSTAATPTAATPTTATPTSFVRISGSRSPPALATPVFASSSAPQPSVSRQIQSSTLAPPRSPADVPLPPSPLITQGSPAMASSTFAASSPSHPEGAVQSRLSVESRKTDRSEQTTVATSELIPGTEADVDSRRTDRSGDLSSNEGTRVTVSEKSKFDAIRE
ncbi:hypothetical protein QFC20_002656 [Naganishia adeliensis]|uniref:Uncharacterized protein n=1 Tax=Naganishia adeliensis TaxID=92952 RepID=A0ACC2WJB0_9TREE|nr:hypothetical protein QFC20_002656 [Naganishia adeliensis]